MEAVLKLTNAHAQQLLNGRVIRFNKNWDMIDDQTSFDVAASTSSSPSSHLPQTTEKPQYVIFLLHPNNIHVPSLSAKDQPREYSDDWFKQEIQEIDQSKEVFDEYFHYLKKHELVTSLKVHDHYYERWSQFSMNSTSQDNDSHYVMYMKVLNDGSIPSTDQSNPSNEYEVGGTLAFSVKDVIVDGQRVRMGLSGSGWLRPKFRPIQEAKLIPWFLQLLMFKEVGVRYFYAHVFEDNARSLGFIEKSGMIPSRFRMNFVGTTLSVANITDISSNSSSLQKLNEDQFDTLMRSLYTSGNFMLDNLRDLYNHPNFKGCYVDHDNQVTFQLWKCKYATNVKVKENLPAYMVINMTQSNSTQDITPEQFERIEQLLQTEILPNLIANSSSSDNLSELPNVNTEPASRCSVFYVTNSAPLRTLICEKHSQNPSLSFATLAYTFQDNDMFMFYVQSKERQKNSPLPNSEPIWNFMMGETESSKKSLNLFLDPRDCTNKPLVWSDEIKKTVSSESLNKMATSTPKKVSASPSKTEATPSLTATTTESPLNVKEKTPCPSDTKPLTSSTTVNLEKFTPSHDVEKSSSMLPSSSSILKWALALTPVVLAVSFGIRKLYQQSSSTHQ